MTEEDKEGSPPVPKIEVNDDQREEIDKKSEVGSQIGNNLDDDDEVKEAEGDEDEEGEGVEKGEDEGTEGEPDELSEEATALKHELQKIIVAPPMNPKIMEDDEIVDPEKYPESYRVNTNKEKLCLLYAASYTRQYAQMYAKRKPLLLKPINECGVEKLVCTTIKPTLLPYKPLYDWKGAAEFVADYLDFVTLDPEHEPPKRLRSPTTILEFQRANCFEYSTLLVSFLIAAGYDAYVVSGYATREICIMDETREVCPLLSKKREASKKEERPPMKRYQVRPPKDLQSKFEIKMKKRSDEAKEKERRKKLEEEEEKDIEAHKPLPDPLFGTRVHSWVLILAGKRGVEENFFIEPFTGLPKAVDDPEYLGIESIWNNKNFWANMQSCEDGLKGIQYDLGDISSWEYMFPSNEKPELKLPDDEYAADNLEIEEEEEKDIEKHLDIPKSWVKTITLSLRDFQTRCPSGKKTKLYKRAKLERFAPYLMDDGIVSRLSSFSDRELIDLEESKEVYEHRADKLLTRDRNHKTNWITENFSPGRPKHLKKHIYKATESGPESERTMIFFHHARVNGLERRLETPTEMTEHFKDREDFLFYRHVLFAQRTKTFGPASSGTSPRTILRIVEHYHRNEKVPADEDISVLTFNCADKKISITYHTCDEKISASTREFTKPDNWDDKTAPLIFHEAEMHSTFQVNPHDRKKKQVELYQLLEDLLKREEKSKESVRASEKEVRDILEVRQQEDFKVNLDVSVYDVQRNDKAKKLREELERRAAEEKLRQEEMEVDYLAPFLSLLDDPNNIQYSDALKLSEECLRDLKHRLIDKANLIQARFEKETAELQEKQQWYQRNQVQMQKDDVNSYLAYCSEAMFKIHILQLRLDRHKEQAPAKYMELQRRLTNDARLRDHLKGSAL
ncbi:DgyrCDS12424 [Dimorphilus gyrociliatus]|uniref:Dynein regulatory complex subunit 7 n=1 Tax=Dimorphilus gyrociliatus TaxID=2664684 RepID=A0A7I8W6G4_9ANNE|nr:DgyrCDS12424 [Dimorphilus gyrociliatus]